MSKEMHRLHDYLNSPEYKEKTRRCAEQVLEEYGGDVVEMAAHLSRKRDQEQDLDDGFLCAHCGGTISNVNTVHSVFFDDDGRRVQCVTLPRILRPFEEENR